MSKQDKTSYSSSRQNTHLVMSKRAGHKSNIKRLWKWLDSYELVSSAIEEHGDLVELLEAGGGICKIENFLPEFAAEGILEVLEQCEESDWNVSKQPRPATSASGGGPFCC